MGSTRAGSSWRGWLRPAALLSAAAIAISACASGVDDAGLPSLQTSAESSRTSTSSPSADPSGSAVVAAGCGAEQLEQMGLRRKLAQLIVVGVTGTADARQVVEREQIGGVFIGSWTDKSILTSGAVKDISADADIPIMVTVDQEGGRVSRLSSLGIDWPSPRQLAQTQSADEVRALGARMGRQMAELGITVDFAPSIDVSDESDGEVIGDRSFSNDPAVVTEYGGALAAGLSDAGIMPVYKHFPGHGHGSGDSHLGSVTSPPLEQLQTSDLVPFRELLRDPGDAGVMVGHLIVPGLTEPQLPASLSPKAIGMLRTGQGYDGPPFDGVVFSDDLSSMAAISAQYPIEEAAVMSIEAGADVALWITTDRVTSVLDAMEQAVEQGSLTPDRVDGSVVRVLRAKGLLDC